MNTLGEGVRDGLVRGHIIEEGPVALELVLTRVERVTLARHSILLEHIADHPNEKFAMWNASDIATILAHREHCLRHP